jgi:hypothetical protein
MVHGSISELSMVPLRVMGGGTDHVIVASAVAPASEAPEQTPPLRLRAKSGRTWSRRALRVLPRSSSTSTE